MSNPIRIHMADDDEDDRLLVRDALQEIGHTTRVGFSVDGVDLMDFLRQRGQYAAGPGQPLPDLLLLDLNMPRKDGRECLADIRADAALSHLVVLVLTTSSVDEDVRRCYQLGVNTVITKPVAFDAMVRLMARLVDYWDDVASRPVQSGRRVALPGA